MWVVASCRDQERDVEGELSHALEHGVVRFEGAGREEAAHEEHEEPGRALLDIRTNRRREVAFLHRRDGAHLLDVFGLLLGDDVEDVVGGDDAQHLTGLVDHRQGVEIVLGEDPRHLFLIELGFLSGREKLQGYNVTTLITY